MLASLTLKRQALIDYHLYVMERTLLRCNEAHTLGVGWLLFGVVFEVLFCVVYAVLGNQLIFLLQTIVVQNAEVRALRAVYLDEKMFEADLRMCGLKPSVIRGSQRCICTRVCACHIYIYTHTHTHTQFNTHNNATTLISSTQHQCTPRPLHR